MLCKQESCSEIALRDAKFAVNLSFGEAAVQLQMTREDVIALTIDGLAQIWKVCSPAHTISISRRFEL